jgi:hypothetical protein
MTADPIRRETEALVPPPVATLPDSQLCKWCGQPLSMIGRLRRTRRKFCNSRCRNGWHLSRRKQAMEQIRQAVELLNGAIQLLHGDDE